MFRISNTKCKIFVSYFHYVIKGTLNCCKTISFDDIWNSGMSRRPQLKSYIYLQPRNIIYWSLEQGGHYFIDNFINISLFEVPI